MIELRWLKKKAEPFDAGFPVYHHILQHRIYETVFDHRGGSMHWSEWRDVPTQIEDAEGA